MGQFRGGRALNFRIVITDDIDILYEVYGFIALTVFQPDSGGNNALQSLVDALESGEDTSATLLQYTPSTPAPENINCYVEIPTVSSFFPCSVRKSL